MNFELNSHSAQCFIASINNLSIQHYAFNRYKKPEGYPLVLYFANHIECNKKIDPIITSMIKNRIGIVYVCDSLPINIVVSSYIVYILVSWADFIPTLFKNPQIFNYVSGLNISNSNVKKFSHLYSIPICSILQQLISQKQDAQPKNKTILVKMSSGELGDKLVALSLISKLKEKYKDYKIDIFLHSERFNTLDGYCALFQDVAHSCSINLSEFNENEYEKIFEFSAYGIHNIEIEEECQKGYLNQSRFQRWSACLDLDNPLQKLAFCYKVRSEDGYSLEKKYSLHKIKKPLVGIFPLSSNKTKDWEQVEYTTNSKWQKVIDYLTSLGYTCIVIHYGNLNFKNCLNLFNLLPRELGYIISKLQFAIGVEAGLTHFCGLLGKPMLVFVGSSSQFVLRHYNKVRILKRGFCHSCNRFITPNLQSRCGTLNNNPTSNCITSITVADVINEIEDFRSWLKI